MERDGRARRAPGPSCAGASPRWRGNCRRSASAGRPRRGLPAEHARHHRRLPRLRQHRRGVVGVLARHGAGGGARPLPPDRAQAAVRRRRLRARRRNARPARGARAAARRAAVGARAGARARGPVRPAPTRPARGHDFAALVADDAPFEPRWLPFDHPLWIVYSSGTTGLPKAIVHGHGGVMLEALKAGAAQRPRAEHRHRRPLPLVQLDRLDHVEFAARRAARRQHRLHLRRQPAGKAGTPGALWRFAERRGATFSAPARPSTRAA